VTRSLFASIADIKGFGPSSAGKRGRRAAAQAGFVLDRDRLAAAFRVVLGPWLAYLIWIYTEIPGDTAFVIMMAPFGMALATMPLLPVMTMFVPAVVGVAFASLLYIFVMPHLSSFLELGPLIFAVTFVICYLFHTPRQGLGRAFGLTMFVLIAGVSNQQSYSFLSVANTALMFPLVFLLLALTAHIPFPGNPEKVFLRLLRRFFHSAAYLLTTMPWGITETPTRLDRWRQAFHTRELATLPAKLAAWGKAVDTRALPGTAPEQVEALTTDLQALAYRLQELLDARASPQSELVMRELLTDVRAWRLRVLEVFDAWSRGLAPESAHALRQRMSARLERLEERVEETMNKAPEGALGDEDKEHLYRILGAYRGLSVAGLAYAVSADGIQWETWHESRF
jgi:ElaB/YqjD/DUF883 family membrane-anchored ribosome-binding protein